MSPPSSVVPLALPVRIRGLVVGMWVVLAAACAAPGPATDLPPGVDVVRVEPQPRATRANNVGAPRILCVTAHPDDEIAFAGVVYKTVTHLGGTVELCVLTDGQGGFKYASLAEPVYGLALTDEAVGRAALPAIRREELRRGCAWLGIGTIYHVDQPDHRYTQDVDEVLGPDAAVWDVAYVRRVLARLLEVGDYDVLLLLAPTAETHAHHQAASLLALEAVAALPDGERPAVLCVRTEGGDEDAAPAAFGGLPGWPLSRAASEGVFVFDRRQPLGFRGRLDYGIVANWAIAEHKSQGTMQLLAGTVQREVYTALAPTPDWRQDELARWFAALAEPQFEAREYGVSAGTNASSTAAGSAR